MEMAVPQSPRRHGPSIGSQVGCFHRAWIGHGVQLLAGSIRYLVPGLPAEIPFLSFMFSPHQWLLHKVQNVVENNDSRQGEMSIVKKYHRILRPPSTHRQLKADTDTRYHTKHTITWILARECNSLVEGKSRQTVMELM